MSTDVLQSLNLRPLPPAIRIAASDTASLFFISSCFWAGESVPGGPWRDESLQMWAQPQRRTPGRKAAGLTNRGTLALAPLVMEAAAVLATRAISVGLRRGARGARALASMR